jgi:predicted phosphohydrolase
MKKAFASGVLFVQPCLHFKPSFLLTSFNVTVSAYFCVMIFQYASDLHLEFPENEVELWKSNLKPMADTLLLAGDIVPFKKITQQEWFFDYLSANFKLTYWVPGNHEYYHDDLASKRGFFEEQIRPNVFLVNDFAVTVNDIRLIFATMWTDVKPNHHLELQRRMNDFHLISMHGKSLTCDDLSIEHKRSVAFVKNELTSLPGIKKVVITHHVPTFMNYPPEYFGDVLNEGFAVNLTDYICDHGPDYWIYGHHHQNVPGFKTSLITNQMGYVRNLENSLFDRSKTFSLIANMV